MAFDPIDYDVVELRELARRRGDRYVEDGFLWPEPSEGFPPLDELADVDHEVSWTGSYEERQKPYLDALPSTKAGDALVTRWVERLVEHAGFDGAVEAFAYYEALGWITEGVEAALHDYMLAAGYHPGGSFDQLDRSVHVDSLARVIALAQMRTMPQETGDDPPAEPMCTDSSERPTATEPDGGDG